MKTVTIDTNAFIRFFLNDIPEQKEVVEKLLKQARNGKLLLLVPYIVIFEVEFILSKYYSKPKEERIEKLESIVGSNYIKVEDKKLLKKALEIFKQKNLDLADCFIFAYSEDKDAELFTFDKALKKLK